MLPPIGYFDFLVLMKKSKFVLTDSGGIQEEATAPPMRKYVLVLRLTTERPEAVNAGFAKVVGIEKEKILSEIRTLLSKKLRLLKHSPFGNGDASKKIVNSILKNQAKDSL